MEERQRSGSLKYLMGSSLNKLIERQEEKSSKNLAQHLLKSVGAKVDFQRSFIRNGLQGMRAAEKPFL